MSRREIDEIFRAYCASSHIGIAGLGEVRVRIQGGERPYQGYQFTSELVQTSSIDFAPKSVLLDGKFECDDFIQSIEIIIRNHFTGKQTSIQFTSPVDFKTRLPDILKGKPPAVKLPDSNEGKPVDNAEFQRRVVDLLEEIVRKLEKE